MRFSELPQFTRRGNYEVSDELKYFVRFIEEEIEGSGLVLNPDFQRGHVWTEEQQIAFIEYFLMGGLMQPIYLNSPNWPDVRLDGTYVCVDGLQRITAFRRFYHNEIKAFGKYYNEYEGKPSNWICMNVNNLETREEVLKWYIELNSGGTPHTKEEIERVRKMLLEEQEKNRG